MLNRSGNVHDSNGAKEFVLECIAAVRAVRHRRTLIEVRMDSAFFSDEILTALEQAQVRYTISVPFARFLSLKEIIERRIDWQPIDPMRDAFEKSWQSQSSSNSATNRETEQVVLCHNRISTPCGLCFNNDRPREQLHASG